MAGRQDIADHAHKYPNRYSLRRRLVVWLFFPGMIIGLLALWDAYDTALGTVNSILDRVLAGSAMAIAEKIELDQSGKLQVDTTHIHLDMMRPAQQDKTFYKIEAIGGTFISGTKSLNFPHSAKTDSQKTTFSDLTYQQSLLRAVAYNNSISSGGTTISYRIIVAETTNARNDQVNKFMTRTGIRFIATLVIAFTTIWVIVGISLRPLDQLQVAISRRNPDELHPIDQDVPLEVEELVDTINSFMHKLDNALDALRNFTGNASHQLRTPMAIIKTQLALTSRASTLEEAKNAAKIGDQAVSHAERILSQLLLLARVDQANSRRIDTPPINLTQITKQITEQYLQMAETHKQDLGFQSLETDCRPIYCRANPMLMEELLRNLVENAIKYSGEGSEITVRVLSNPGLAILEVEDNGPGIPAELRVQVRARFSRVAVPIPSSPSKTQNAQTSGAGLGLAIVSEIAKLFNGSLDLYNGRDHKGLIARVSFPV